MEPPPQLVRWLMEKYPKPTVDEVRVSVVCALTDPHSTSPALAFAMLRLGDRGAQSEPCHRHERDNGARRVPAPHVGPYGFDGSWYWTPS